MIVFLDRSLIDKGFNENSFVVYGRKTMPNLSGKHLLIRPHLVKYNVESNKVVDFVSVCWKYLDQNK